MKKEYATPKFNIVMFEGEDIMKTDVSSIAVMNSILESESLLIYNFE